MGIHLSSTTTSNGYHKDPYKRESKYITAFARSFGSTRRNLVKCEHRTSKVHQDCVAAVATTPAVGKKRDGGVQDGYVVQTFSQKGIDTSCDWEWNEPIPEIISDVIWSDDEDMNEIKTTNKTSHGKNGCGEKIGEVFAGGDGGGKVVVDGGGGEGKKSDYNGGVSVHGNDVAGARNTAPRGKSWMIVTQKMMKEYSP